MFLFNLISIFWGLGSILNPQYIFIDIQKLLNKKHYVFLNYKS